MSFFSTERETSEHLSQNDVGPARTFAEAKPVVTHYSEAEILTLLRKRGAKTLQRVRFRANRSTIWSLTRHGTTLNLHIAYRTASANLLDAFAFIVTAPGTRSRRYREAVRMVREWPPLGDALNAVRAANERVGRPSRMRRCDGSTEQRQFLRRVYQHLNRQYFGELLESNLPLRFSGRMVSRLGQLLTNGKKGAEGIVEIALNIDLMLEGNEDELVETLAHEMAHAVDYQLNGRTGHGATWKRWALKAGCEPVACTQRHIRRRRRRRVPVTHVPTWPFLHEEPAERQLLPIPSRRGMQLDLFESSVL